MPTVADKSTITAGMASIRGDVSPLMLVTVLMARMRRRTIWAWTRVLVNGCKS
jgi:hypothetical protein